MSYEDLLPGGSRWPRRMTIPHHTRGCGQSDVYLGVFYKSNGSAELRRVCRTCRSWDGSGLRIRDFDGWQRLPVIADNRGRGAAFWTASSRTCARCGAGGPIETHHWAPWELFEDAHLWPTADLCRPCHTLWHTTMNRARRARGARQVSTT